MSFFLRIVPSSTIRWAGKLQFRYPWTKTLINAVARLLTGKGTIVTGAGKGLYFNATGCNPGYLAGTSEPLEQELLIRYSTEGSVVYDLGANAGFYAVIAARAVGPSGKVFAFEPTPQLAARIQENASKNKLKNVEVIQVAVSNTDGEVNFGIVGALSVENSIRSANEDSTRVSSLRVDTFCNDHLPPNLMLIDIEGAEIDALHGALKTIQKHRPIIMVEVHWLGTAFTDFVKQSLSPLGYRLTTYSGDAIPDGNVRYHGLLMPNPVQLIP